LSSSYRSLGAFSSGALWVRRGVARAYRLVAGHRLESALLTAVGAVGAWLRFSNFQNPGGWDSDQGSQMLALWHAVQTRQLPQLGPGASVGGFHHGALYYDLLLPSAWLGNGDPRWVQAELSLLGLLMIPVLWWVARSMAGRAAGLITALLTAVLASTVNFSTFIWNPTMVGFGAAIVLLGVWQAWHSRRPSWWVVAAAGLAVAGQAHVLAWVLAVPVVLAWLADLRRNSGPERRRVLRWALVGAALIVVTYLPLVAYELTHGFSETRGILHFIFKGSGAAYAQGPASRLAIAWLRCIAWPLTGWPLYFNDPMTVPIGAATALSVGLAWRVLTSVRGAKVSPSVGEPSPTTDRPAVTVRDGAIFLAVSLGAMIAVLGLFVRNVSEFNPPGEQYHIGLDAFVIVAVGLVLGAVWNVGAVRSLLRLAGRILTLAAVVGLVAWNSNELPRQTTDDQSWLAAQHAATRIEADAHGGSIGNAVLPSTMNFDTYEYPLVHDGAATTSVAQAQIVVVLCYSSLVADCDGGAEQAWVASNLAGARLDLIDTFEAQSDRTIAVFERAPSP